VSLQHLTQALDDLDPEGRVLPTLEDVRRVTRTVDGEVTATSLLERFGFTGDRLTTRIGDLSGGERRRFQLLRLLMTEPNVLLLDEPTNDLDTDTLAALEDLLDSWAGTLVVVSHDRYLLERVCDTTVALLAGDERPAGTIGQGGMLAALPGGVDEYLRRRAAALAAVPLPTVSSETAPAVAKARPGSAEERAARKTMARLDKQLERLAEQEATLNAAILEAGQDYERLAVLAAELDEVSAQRDAVESEWLEAAELLE
jgi:ATP-binding cassette subfamily F protein uup